MLRDQTGATMTKKRSRMRERLHWLFDDPAAAEGTREEKMKVFRQVRDEIGSKIR